jgi:hypothetical protein
MSSSFGSVASAYWETEALFAVLHFASGHGDKRLVNHDGALHGISLRRQSMQHGEHPVLDA